MADKRKRHFSISSFLLNFVTLIPRLFTSIQRIVMLVEYEACMAGRKIFMLCVLLLFCFTILISTWACLLTMLFFYLNLTLQLNLQLSLFIILIINIVALTIIALIISNLKRGILFPETRELIRHAYRHR
jgi:hypothetical protein